MTPDTATFGRSIPSITPASGSAPAIALNIIVVEDHDELREVTVAALCSMGHAARGVNCAEALDDALADFHAELLVLDLNLPGEDGLSLARRMRAAGPD
ncbi:MAG: response regulator, partial [Rhodocyclales bacterium]|nr:response regulator [Rhodocyclales bacterium]